MPGSPSLSLPELLMQAEEGLEKTASGLVTPAKRHSTERDPLKTPAPDGNPYLFDGVEPGLREWTKDDWKLLDACFTDERLQVAENQELGNDVLADVDDMEMGNVVERFVSMVGGDSVVEKFGSTWDR